MCQNPQRADAQLSSLFSRVESSEVSSFDDREDCDDCPLPLVDESPLFSVLLCEARAFCSFSCSSSVAFWMLARSLGSGEPHLDLAAQIHCRAGCRLLAIRQTAAGKIGLKAEAIQDDVHILDGLPFKGRQDPPTRCLTIHCKIQQ